VADAGKMGLLMLHAKATFRGVLGVLGSLKCSENDVSIGKALFFVENDVSLDFRCLATRKATC